MEYLFGICCEFCWNFGHCRRGSLRILESGCNKAWISFKISEAEHGYASSLPMPDDFNTKKRSKSKKSQGNR